MMRKTESVPLMRVLVIVQVGVPVTTMDRVTVVVIFSMDKGVTKVPT